MSFFETVLQDLRYGARTLLRQAKFTTVSVFALALGIGVNRVLATFDERSWAPLQTI